MHSAKFLAERERNRRRAGGGPAGRRPALRCRVTNRYCAAPTPTPALNDDCSAFLKAMQVSIASMARLRPRSPAPGGWVAKKDWTSALEAASQKVAVEPVM